MELTSLLRDSAEACDLAAFKSPYLPKTFSKWRKSMLPSPPTLSSLTLCDDQLLPHFLEKVYLQYYTSLTLNPSADLDLPPALLSDPTTRDSLQSAASSIALWSTEIELSVDILDRAQVYGLYTVPRELAGLYEDLQKEWSVEEEPVTKRLYRFLVHLMAYATDKLTDITKRHIVNIAALNFAHAKSSIISGAVSAYMYGAFPWPVLALLGSQMTFVIGGWLVMKLGRGLSRSVDSSQVRAHLAELRKKFVTMREELKAINSRTSSLIRALISSPFPSNEGKSELATMLNSFLVQKQDDSVYRLMEEQGEAQEEIVFYEDEDWMVMDFATIR